MDADDNLIISWHDFESNSPELIRNLWKDEDFSDVTLATDDGQIVRAHRVILCSASSKLKRLLRAHEHHNPVVYIPGIDSGHLVNLVKFIYQGKCQVKEELLGEFLNCGKSLGVENLTEYFQNRGNEAKYETAGQNETTAILFKEGDGFSAESEENENPPEKIGTSISLNQPNLKSGFCKICNRKFINLKRHINTRHSKREKKTCTVCDMKFARKITLRTHFETQHNGKEKKKCNMCKYEAHKNSAITDHIERVHQGKMLSCKDCSFQAKTKHYMQYHMKSFHDGITTLKCDQSEFKFEYKAGSDRKMLIHKETMHGKTIYKCDHCDYESKSRPYFTKHKKDHVRPKIVCGQCKFSTKLATFLKYHIKSAHEGFTWPCDACDRKFNTPALLRLHKGSEHEQKLYTRSCTICDFTVETKDNKRTTHQMNNHMDAIHLDIIYDCQEQECSYTTKSSQKMKRHTKYHKIRKSNISFVCDQCSYTSKQKGHLDIHVRSKHKGEILKCDLCNYSATQLSNLTRHKRAKHTELIQTLDKPLEMKTSF